jgi:hypothetical protein
MSSSDYTAATDKMLAEIVREAEARLQAQLTAAIAADQRAMTFAGLMVAAAAAMIGAALGVSREADVTLPTIVTGLFLFAAAVLAVVAARPVAWDFTGNTPSAWVKSIADGDSLHTALSDMASFYAEMIEANEIAIANAAYWIRLSMGSALASLVIGFAVAIGRVI